VPSAYSLDLRTKVVEACARGDRTQQQVAHDFGIGIASVVRYVIRARQGNLAYEPAKTVPSRRVLDDAGEQQLLDLARATPDATESELVDALAELDLHVSRSTVNRILHRHGFTRKKRPTSPPSVARTA
jgi:transposase